jgi:hypothetical protein
MKKIIFISIFILAYAFAFLITLATAVECIGQNCPTNISLNVTSPIIIITPIGFSATGQAIYEVLASSGAGLGSFLQILGIALPMLLIGLAFVVIIIAIGYALVQLFKLWKIYKK